MRVPVLTAVADPRWEAGLVSAFERSDHGVAVVRRCVDLPDLLAAASSGTAKAVLLSADLRRLDRDALTRLELAGVAVIGLVPPGDEQADRRLRQLGVRWVLAADAAPEVIARAVADAVQAGVHWEHVGAVAYAHPLAGLPVEPPPAPPVSPEVVPGTGRLVAVWGPTGAPGRTTVALNLAAEIAALGTPTLLVDADSYGGVVGQHLGLLEEAPGLPAACRLANTGALDLPALGGLVRQVTPTLSVLTGIARADRWPELRASALEAVLALARTLATFVVVDCGFCLERDEELSYDTAAPRRNAATLTVLDQADTIIAVAAADPVGLQRLVRALADLRELLPGAEPLVVANRLRKGPIGADPESAVRQALLRYAGVERVHPVPDAPGATDDALRLGRTLAECAPGSPARRAIAELAAALVGVPRQRGRRHRARRRVVAS